MSSYDNRYGFFCYDIIPTVDMCLTNDYAGPKAWKSGLLLLVSKHSNDSYSVFCLHTNGTSSALEVF